MKKITKFIRILILTLIFTFTFNGFGLFSGQGSTSASDSKGNEKYLQYVNRELRKNLSILEKRLDTIEKNFIEIRKYDNMIYSQILGYTVDNDTLYQNNNINYLEDNYDTINIKTNVRSLRTSKMIARQMKKLRDEYTFTEVNKHSINYYPTNSPIKINEVKNIASGFGWRKHPVYHKPLFHEGIDIAAELGTNVYSTACGVIKKTKHSKYRYGNHILVNHENGYETLYAHLTQIFVEEGEYVRKGELIGTVGSTGLSTSPHLHYEVHFYNKKKNPLNYLYVYVINDLIVSE